MFKAQRGLAGLSRLEKFLLLRLGVFRSAADPGAPQGHRHPRLLQCGRGGDAVSQRLVWTPGYCHAPAL